MQTQGRNISTSSDDCQTAIDVSPKRNLKHQTSRQFDQCREATLSDLSVDQLKDLVSSLKHTLGSAKAENYEDILQDECIDGSCFSQLGHDELVDIGFDPNLKTLCQQLLAPPSPKGASGNHPSLTTDTLTEFFSDSNMAAMPTSPSSAASKAAPTSPSRTYGQLVVLGFREHRLTNEQVIYPVGSSNDVFPLVRQAESTGVKVSSTNVFLRQRQAKSQDVDNPDGKGKEIEYVESLPSACSGPHTDLAPNKAEDSHSTADNTHRMVLESTSNLLQPVQTKLRGVTGEPLLPYKVEVGYTTDPAFDMFQVGRYDGDVSSSTDSTGGSTDGSTGGSTGGVSAYPSQSPSLSPPPSLRRVNDIVVKGLVLAGSAGARGGGSGAPIKGAISRVACRFLCERATGRTYVFAGGFNSLKVVQL